MKPTAGDIDTILERFDTSPTPFLEVEVSEALRPIAPDEPSARALWWAESAAFSFWRPRGDGSSPWGTAFGPMVTGAQTDGTPVYFPDVREADSGTFARWMQRAGVARHPILRARYADLSWDFARTIIKAKPDVEFARRAIDAYIDATALSYGNAVQPIGYIERAFDLAVSIGDATRIAAVVTGMFALFGKVAASSHAGSWPFLFDNLFDQRKITLSDQQRQDIIRTTEHILQRASTPGADFDPWSAQGAAERLARVYRKAGRLEEVQRVLRTFGSAFEFLAKDAAPSLALGWLQPVYETFCDAGMTEDAQRIQRICEDNARRVPEDMKTLSATVELPSEQINEYLEALTASDLASAYERIATQFLTKAAKARDVLKTLMERTPLMARIGVQSIADGHIVAEAGSIEEDPDGRLIMQLAQLIQMESPLLTAALSKAHERYTPTAHDIWNVLRQSPVFPQEHEELVTEGLQAYLDGDAVKAIHVLLPQIEAALRVLLRILGYATSKPMRSSKGVMQAVNLNDLLTHPAIKTVFGTDTSIYFQCLLNEPRGHNVRNRVAHGLATKKYLGQPLADRIMHVLLTLRLIKGDR